MTLELWTYHNVPEPDRNRPDVNNTRPISGRSRYIIFHFSNCVWLEFIVGSFSKIPIDTLSNYNVIIPSQLRCDIVWRNDDAMNRSTPLISSRLWHSSGPLWHACGEWATRVIMTSKRRRFDVIITWLLRRVPTGTSCYVTIIHWLPWYIEDDS